MLKNAFFVDFSMSFQYFLPNLQNNVCFTLNYPNFLNMKKHSYLFLADGFEEIEALATVDILRRANIKVDTVAITPERWCAAPMA